VRISQDYPLQTRPSKQPNADFSGYRTIPSNFYKYPKHKQGFSGIVNFQRYVWPFIMSKYINLTVKEHVVVIFQVKLSG
jgi:hypothetical protein